MGRRRGRYGKVREQNREIQHESFDVSCCRSLSCRRLSLSEIGCKSFVIRVTTWWEGKRRGSNEVSRITCSEEKGGNFLWSYQRVDIHTQPDWQRDLTSISFVLAFCKHTMPAACSLWRRQRSGIFGRKKMSSFVLCVSTSFASRFHSVQEERYEQLSKSLASSKNIIILH